MILPDRYHYPASFHQRSEAILEKALRQAPAYAPWKGLGPGPSAPLDERYDALPELTKQIMRDHFPHGLAPDDKDVEEGLLREEIEYTFTSGTTGDRVVNIWDQGWWDRAEASAWKLNAHMAKLSYPQREAKLASSLNVGISCEEDLPMASRMYGHRLYLNEKINLIQWQPRHYARMAKELGSYRPVVLEANPALLARLAWWAIDEGVELFSPEVIVFTFEFISCIHVEAIRKVFSSAIVSSYGTTETGFVLQECEHGLLHQNLDFCRIDFHPLKDRYGGPELGRMLVTTFQNPWNIILRFDVGDLVRLHQSGTCPCGREEGLIAEAIEGRVTNSTFSTEGALVTTMALDAALAEVEGLRDYHLEQTSRSGYMLQVMTRSDPEAVSDACRHALETLYGRDGDFCIQVMPNILPGPAGKFRRTQTSFDYDEKELFV